MPSMYELAIKIQGKRAGGTMVRLQSRKLISAMETMIKMLNLYIFFSLTSVVDSWTGALVWFDPSFLSSFYRYLSLAFFFLF